MNHYEIKVHIFDELKYVSFDAEETMEELQDNHKLIDSYILKSIAKGLCKGDIKITTQEGS